MSLKKLFGGQVKLIRNYRGKTQEELAELVDIDIRQLARIESGSSFATAETIERICRALNVTYKEMFSFSQKDEIMTCEDISGFLKNYSKLTKLAEKVAQSDSKTEYLLLAAEALEKKSSLEKLKSIIFGMMLK
ncbi:MAG: helix-turn-helix domain-containing protein [Muribaculaceae bacterium]|nr:helix-turn-helix domain-containing protein [Muribaculaceae bacterium]